MKSEMNTIDTMTQSVITFFSNVNAICVGIFSSIIGYFVPVRDIVHVLLLFFLFDMIFGYLAARKGKKRGGKECKRFSVKIIWNTTIPRALISIILVMAAYMWDSTYNNDVVNTYKAIGWFISGVLIFSIAENGFIITRWGIFLKVREIIRGKIKTETEQDAEEDDNLEEEYKKIMNKNGKRKTTDTENT